MIQDTIIEEIFYDTGFTYVEKIIDEYINLANKRDI